MNRVVALFQSQYRLERAITALRANAFTPDEIAVLLFSTSAVRPTHPGLRGWLQRGGLFGDTMDQTDGVSIMDGITVGASIGGLVGIVWGSQWPSGPVTGAVVGLLGGGLVGLIFDRLIPEMRRDMYETKKLKGLMQIEVTCDSTDRARLAKRILEVNEADQMAAIVSTPGVTEASTGGKASGRGE